MAVLRKHDAEPERTRRRTSGSSSNPLRRSEQTDLEDRSYKRHSDIDCCANAKATSPESTDCSRTTSSIMIWTNKLAAFMASAALLAMVPVASATTHTVQDCPSKCADGELRPRCCSIARSAGCNPKNC